MGPFHQIVDTFYPHIIYMINSPAKKCKQISWLWMTSNDKQIYLFPTLLIKTDTALIKKKNASTTY